MSVSPGFESSPPPMELTDEQRAATETTGREVYVTAAAGSGKTAVLTERVCRLIAEATPDGAGPVELERLLVITFTRKAAREMRERIEKRIREGLEARPESASLRAALDALPRSNIMTIDAFCDRLVRRHFHLVGVSPAVRLADEDEAREIVHAATREVFEASASGERGLEAGVFADLLRSTPPSRSGLLEALESRVDRLRAYVASLEDGPAWMQRARATLEAKRDAESLEALPDLHLLASTIRSELAEVAEALKALWHEAGRHAPNPEDIPAGEAWQTVIDRIEAAAAPPPSEDNRDFIALWRELRDWLTENPDVQTVMKLYTKKCCGPALHQSPLKGLLKKFADDFGAWVEAWFAHSEDQLLEAERLAGAQALALLELAEAVEDRAQAIKRRRSLMSFADMQRSALDLLTDGEGPSAVALQYRDFFEYVLVDEYQDVSPLQDALIRRVARPADPAAGLEGNLFIVGDVKQSIYRFRQAEPTLFRSRLDVGRSPADKAQPLTLNLSTNFRSREGVLDAVNRVFQGLMDRPIGDVTMEGDALLYPGREDRQSDAGPCVELQWLDPAEIKRDDASPEEDNGSDSSDSGGDADLRSLEAEARWIAARIRELEHAGPSTWIPDRDAPGGRRPIRPSDCAILVRSLSRSVDTWIAELGRWKINVRTAGGESLWKSVEGEDLLAALRLVDQPFDDLALATFLRSPMGGFSDDDLLCLRMRGGSGPFHEAVWRCAGRAPSPTSGEEANEAPPLEDGKLTRRLRTFFERLDRWRERALTHPAEAVLDAILRDTAYEAHVLGSPRADAAIRNIDELREKMRARERLNGHGPALADFLRALDTEGGGALEKEDESLRDDPDAVQLMTIHKSKGLEFPVVFLARMAQRYHIESRSTAVLFAPGGSIALPAVDPARKIRLEPPSLASLYSRESRATRGEELRLLYVAMTRARERLVLVACARGLRHARDEGSSLLELGTPAPAFARIRASTPAAMIGARLYALNRSGEPPPWLHVHEDSAIPAPPSGLDLEELRRLLVRSDDEAPQAWREVIDARAKDRLEAPPADEAPETLRFASLLDPEKHFHTPLKARPSQLSRTEATRPPTEQAPLVKRSELDLFLEREMLPTGKTEHAGAPTSPRFSLQVERERLDPLQRGALAHAFLQHLDLRAPLDAEGLRREARRLFELGMLGIDDPASLDALPCEGIAAFFESELGRRLVSRPGSVNRELPFARWLRAGELQKLGGDFDHVDPDRLVTVQGVIDCVMDEGDRVTLIDYKTDTVRTEADVGRLGERYTPQLRQYAEALRTAWRLERPPEACLVLLQTGRVVPVSV